MSDTKNNKSTKPGATPGAAMPRAGGMRPGGGMMGPGGPGAMMKGEKAKDFAGTMKKLVAYLEKYRLAILVVMVFALGSTVFSIVGPKIDRLGAQGVADVQARVPQVQPLVQPLGAAADDDDFLALERRGAVRELGFLHEATGPQLGQRRAEWQRIEIVHAVLSFIRCASLGARVFPISVVPVRALARKAPCPKGATGQPDLSLCIYPSPALRKVKHFHVSVDAHAIISTIAGPDAGAWQLDASGGDGNRSL